MKKNKVKIIALAATTVAILLALCACSSASTSSSASSEETPKTGTVTVNVTAPENAPASKVVVTLNQAGGKEQVAEATVNGVGATFTVEQGTWVARITGLPTTTDGQAVYKTVAGHAVKLDGDKATTSFTLELADTYTAGTEIVDNSDAALENAEAEGAEASQASSSDSSSSQSSNSGSNTGSSSQTSDSGNNSSGTSGSSTSGGSSSSGNSSSSGDSGSTSGGSSSSGGSSGDSGSGTSGGGSTPAHEHTWVWVSNPVTVTDQAAYDEPVYEWILWCPKCQCQVDKNHIRETLARDEEGHSLTDKRIQTGTTHHDAVTHTEDHGYYQCSGCGATK